MPDETKKSPQLTTAEILQQLQKKLPDNFASLEPLLQLDALVKTSSEVFAVDGDWILVNGNMSLLELLTENKG